MTDTQLIKFSKKGNFENFKTFIENNKPNLNFKDDDGNTSLNLICRQQSIHNPDLIEMVKFLIKNKADVEVLDKEGNTALIIASQHDNKEIIKTLVCLGKSDVNAETKDGETPFSYATSYHRTDNFEIAKMLIEHGSDVNAKTYSEGLTPLMKACRNNNKLNLEMVKFLVQECKVNLDIKDIHGNTALYYANQTRLPEMIKLVTKEEENPLTIISIKDKIITVKMNEGYTIAFVR